MMNSKNDSLQESIKTRGLTKKVSTWKKWGVYVIASILIILGLLAVFFLLINILLPFRGRFSPEVIPWIYLVVYVLTVFITLIFIGLIFNAIKDKPSWNKYFFDFDKHKHN